MKASCAFLVASFSWAAGPLGAQCSGSPSVQVVCNRAIDALKTFHPAAGIIVSGGNPSLGSARALGGLGHGFVSARVNAVKVIVPNPDTTSGGATVEGLVPAPVVELGVGLWPGLRGGLLAVDGLLSATLVPTHAVDNLRVDSGATRVGSLALGIGYGVRVSAWRGAFPIPAVSLSVMRRSLPRVAYGRLAPSSLSAGDAFEFDTDLRATNVRLTASYRLPVVDVAAGIGFDRYTSHGRLRYYDNPPLNTLATVPFEPRNSRQLVFVNAAAQLSALALGAEIGYQTGKDQRLSTTYAFDATGGHVFGGIGLRFGF
ncbi:MAG: hypothetical protein ACREMF_04900 [Gemmatimonadales bacterium]